MKFTRLLATTALAVAAIVAATGTGASAAPPSTTSVNGYYISVKTGDLSGAGTDANIYIWMYGQAISGHIQLDDSRDNFERNTVETFGPFYMPELGQVNGIGLRKDSAGSAWYPEWVIIQNITTGTTAYCPVNVWYPDGAATKYFACPSS